MKSSEYSEKKYQEKLINEQQIRTELLQMDINHLEPKEDFKTLEKSINF